MPFIRLFLFFTIAANSVGCFAATATTSTASPDRPNILILHVDQWRAQAFGYAGDKNVKTPNIDAFARGSASFVNAVSPLPVCTPARASLLTGQRPLTTGLFMNDIPLKPEANTIAEVLAAAGYDTGYIGKWHLDGNQRRVITPPGPRRQGFQYWKAINCTHNYNKSAYFANDNPEMQIWEGYDAIAQGKDAENYISDDARHEKPFFLMLSWGPPHDPYGTAPAEYKKMYDPATLELRPNVPKQDEAKVRKDLAGYYAHMTALDDAFGGIIETLKREKLYDNTIILLTADHGDLLGSQGRYGKQAPYDESIRVPLLIHWTGDKTLKPGKYEGLFCTEDVMPTLLGLCGVVIPDGVEGADYSDHMRGGKNPKTEDVADILCVQPFSAKWGRKSGGQEYRGLRDKRYTYVRSLDGPWFLFDNTQDPYQMKNLVNDESTSAVQAKLDTLLMKRLKERGDKFLPGPETARAYGYPELDRSGTVPYTN